ncbi:MAG: hypothetical protein E7661_00715 [Ruminococcaceae bacterium]|nr:hypothetical protein [Oscillospiraceae bacterium]
MKTKDLRIEDLAKKFGQQKGFGCLPEERCCDCILDNCPCLEYAKMAIEFGYEDKEEIKRCTGTAILALLKTQAYYPDRPNKGMKEMRVVDEDDIETEIKRYTEGL